MNKLYNIKVLAIALGVEENKLLENINIFCYNNKDISYLYFNIIHTEQDYIIEAAATDLGILVILGWIDKERFQKPPQYIITMISGLRLFIERKIGIIDSFFKHKESVDKDFYKEDNLGLGINTRVRAPYEFKKYEFSSFLLVGLPFKDEFLTHERIVKDLCHIYNTFNEGIEIYLVPILNDQDQVVEFILSEYGLNLYLQGIISAEEYNKVVDYGTVKWLMNGFSFNRNNPLSKKRRTLLERILEKNDWVLKMLSR